MIKFDVTISEAGKGDATYTNCAMHDGESKFEMMARIMNDHRFIWGIERGIELVASSKVATITNKVYSV